MWNRRMAVAAAIAGLGALVSGAYITSTKVALAPGQPEPSVTLHVILAFLAMGVCAALVAFSAARIWPACALAALIASAATGWNHPLSHGAAVWHAATAHLFTAGIAITLVFLLRGKKPPAIPAGALRTAAILTPFAVFGQIVMGALYRHQVTSIMPHMLGAMVVAGLTLVVSAVVLQNFPNAPELRRSATLLISAVLLQVLLGVTVFILLLLNLSGSAVFVWTATAHVTTGTLVLAASILMAIEI